ncbi:retrovirus-related pol polyprotein from transposon TNT 1-94 [Tanacetum coccineum]|uniref:Retrovirus-related pol polyprotein from transposon TNT 1-94 n=1 Tax=Tanacetum coccineum TaxID=301880 RepID=A0ABQ5CAF1_9ASTR
MTTLADKSLLSGGDNKPPMLKKHLYYLWKSIMELYMMNRPHETIQADCDIKAINIILQGLPTKIYALVSQHREAKDIWEKIKLLMQGTSLTKQERECKLYDEFDKFTYKKGESLHEYYLRFALLLNDMNIYKMPLEQFQIHAHLEQHERHANKVRLMHERNSDPLALVASHQMTQSPYQSHQHSYRNSQHQQFVSPYHKEPKDLHTTNVDQIHAHLEQHERHANEVRFNQLRNLSNHRQQATINNGRVTLQPIQGRQTSLAVGTSKTYTPGASGRNTRKQRNVICYNCKGEGHMSKQCTKPKRKWNDSWFKDTVLLVQAQVSGHILHEEELAFLVDPGIPESLKDIRNKLMGFERGHNVDLRFFYDHTTKQALGFQNPFYLKKAQQLEPKLYVGDIIEKTNLIVIPDSEETLMLAEESRLKMLLKQKDPIMLEKKLNTTPVDYIPTLLVDASMLRFQMTPKVVWLIEFDELKHHLADFDDGSQRKEHTRSIMRVRGSKKTFEVKMNQVLNENERFLEQVINKDIVNVIMNSSADIASVNVHECEKCLKLETELQTDFIEKEIYDKLFKSFSNSWKYIASL